MSGTVYLLHFDERFKGDAMVHDYERDPGGGEDVQRPRKEWPGAQHYIGFTGRQSLKSRLEEHVRGEGSRLVAAMVGRGIMFELARTWEGDRKRERQLKIQGGASRLCPLCKPGLRMRAK